MLGFIILCLRVEVKEHRAKFQNSTTLLLFRLPGTVQYVHFNDRYLFQPTKTLRPTPLKPQKSIRSGSNDNRYCLSVFPTKIPPTTMSKRRKSLVAQQSAFSASQKPTTPSSSSQDNTTTTAKEQEQQLEQHASDINKKHMEQCIELKLEMNYRR